MLYKSSTISAMSRKEYPFRQHVAKEKGLLMIIPEVHRISTTLHVLQELKPKCEEVKSVAFCP
jgi:hypothetical protein